MTDVLKGQWSARTIMVTVQGGRYGNMIETAADAIQLTRGSDVILFLVPTHEGGWQVYGGPQGAFTISGGKANSGFASMTLSDLLTIARLKP